MVKAPSLKKNAFVFSFYLLYVLELRVSYELEIIKEVEDKNCIFRKRNKRQAKEYFSILTKAVILSRAHENKAFVAGCGKPDARPIS